MKNYKKAFLATAVLASMPLIAATSGGPIKVTTFADGYNENPNTCSLREALETARLRTSFGGCVATDTSSIQLEAGVYTLKSELQPQVEVSILGAVPVDWENKNVLINDVINQYPAKIPLQTTIKAENSRIFNTTLGKQSLVLNNIILKGGRTADRGGAIYAAANVVLNSTQILDSHADVAGGAVYLAGNAGNLTITKSLIQGNQAPIGSVLAMHDGNDLGYVKRDITIQSSSLVENGSTTSKSMLEFTGAPVVNLESNTIAQNKANLTSGNLIKFTGDTQAGTVVGGPPSVLSNSSRLTLENNTIVENSAFTTFLYDKLGLKRILFNVMAYNGDVNTYACRYLLGEAENQKNTNLFVGYNAFARSGANSCDLPTEVFNEDETKETNIDVSDTSIGELLTVQIPASAETAFLPLYYPKDNNRGGVVTDETKKAKELVNTGVTDCSQIDQRGLARKTEQALYYAPKARNTCDIGSVELMRLTVTDIVDLKNSSISTLMSDYQKSFDLFDDLVKKPNNTEFLTYYKFRRDQYKKVLDAFADPKKRNDALKYRAIYIDLRNQKLVLPEEVSVGEGEPHVLQFFNPDFYTIKVEALGVGIIDSIINNVEVDENLFCKWNADLEQIMIYRTDDQIQEVEKAYCKYTITSKADPKITSTGLLQADFDNIAPVANNTSVTLKYNQNETATLNLLNFANDEGDTGKNGLGPDSQPDKPHFWRNAEGVELPIRLSNVSSNLIITADHQGNCPAPDEEETCFGGNIYIKAANTFNTFNFTFGYQVYDADKKLSNLATVNVITTGKATQSGGGGSTGIFSLFGLLGLLTYRRLRK